MGKKSGTTAMLADYVMDCYKWSEEYMRVEHEKFIGRYRHFRQVFPKNFGTKSRLYVPKTTALILNVLPRLVGDDPTIKVVPVGDTPQQNARAQQNAIRYELAKMDYFMRLYFQSQDALIYGVGYRHNAWWTQIETIRRRLHAEEIMDLQEFGIPVPEYFMENVVSFDGPWSFDVDIFDYFPDPDHPDPQDSDFVCLADRLSELEMRELAEMGQLRQIDRFLGKMDSPKAGPSTGLSDQSKQTREAIAGTSSPDRYKSMAPKQLKPHPVIDFWGRVPIGLVPPDIRENIKSTAKLNGIQYQPRSLKMNIILTVDHKIVLRAEPFPYFHNEIPVVKLSFMPIKGEHVGLGIVELMRGLQNYELYRRNNLIDNINRNMQGMYTKIKGSRIRDIDLIARPGGTIAVDRHDELRPLENPLVGKIETLYRELGLTEQEWQEVSGFSLFSQGRDAPGVNKTASGVAMLIREANNRINLMRLIGQKLALKTDGMQFISLNKQFIQDPVRLSLIGAKEPLQIGPDTLWGDFDVDVQIAPNEPFSTAMARENLVFLYNLLKASPLATSYDFKPLDEAAMRIFDQEGLIDEVLTPPQQNALAALGSGALQNPAQVAGAQGVLSGGNVVDLVKRLTSAPAA